jgi:DnaJ-class molecular chaperone
MAVEFKDYYRILGVDKTADAKAIKSAYRKLARKHHPDVSKGAGAADKFKEINEAYEVLSDPEKRRRYDSLGPDWQRYAQQPGGQPGGGFPGGFHVEYGDAGDLGGFSDFFRTIFGDLGAQAGAGRPGGRPTGGYDDLEDLLGRGGRARRRRGEDVQASVDISLEEAFAGTRKSLSLELNEPCPTCHGAGNVDGKPCATCHGSGWQRAIRTGQRVRVAGEGGGGADARGDLYLVVDVAPHPLFERKGDDLQLELPVTAPEAALGTSIEVLTLRGRVSMKIPAGTASGRTFRLPGYGMPRVKGGGAGDQLVRTKIVVPTSLTPEERELYTKLKDLRTDNPRAYLG